MPVEMVLGDVEQDGDGRREALDVFELEARDLGDIDVVVAAPVDERDERRADVAGQMGPEPGLLEDPVDQGRRRRLAVRAGDADDPSPEEEIGQLDLGEDRDAPVAGGQDLGEGRHAGARDDEVGLEEGLEPVAARLEDDAALGERPDLLPEGLGAASSR